MGAISRGEQKMKTSSQLGRTVVVVNALAMALAIASCASTKMTSTWTDPSAKGASLSKVAVMAMTKDPGLRRMAEDTAASQLAARTRSRAIRSSATSISRTTTP